MCMTDSINSAYHIFKKVAPSPKFSAAATLPASSDAITLVDEINRRIITSDVNGFISLYLNAGLDNFETNQNFYSLEFLRMELVSISDPVTSVTRYVVPNVPTSQNTLDLRVIFNSSHQSICQSDSQPSPIQLDYPQQNSGMETTGQDEKKFY